MEKPNISKRVLMSPKTPDGWKLEDLLRQLQFEIGLKSAKIENDARPVARAVLRHNQQIVALFLAQAEALQRGSYDLLDAMAPNEGPLGRPRIGAGSDA